MAASAAVCAKAWAATARFRCGSSRSNAAAIPPARTTTDGLSTSRTDATAIPRCSPTSRTARLHTASPARAASRTARAVAGGRRTPARARAARRAAATIPYEPAYASRHPREPQRHRGPLGSTVMCPISPPKPDTPRTMLPSTTMPPPTPVPSVMATRFFPRAPRTNDSPKAALVASFSSVTGTEKYRRASAASGAPAQAGRLGDSRRTPRLASIRPAQPIPTAATPVVPARVRAAAWMARKARAGPSSAGVSISPRASTRPPGETAAILMLVPPISTPRSVLTFRSCHPR